MSVKVNGKTYDSHVEAMNELKIDKKHIRKIREGLAKDGKVEIGKHTFVGTYSPKKATVAKKKATSKKKSAPKKAKALKAKRTAPKPKKKATEATAAQPTTQAA